MYYKCWEYIIKGWRLQPYLSYSKSIYNLYTLKLMRDKENRSSARNNLLISSVQYDFKGEKLRITPSIHLFLLLIYLVITVIIITTAINRKNIYELLFSARHRHREGHDGMGLYRFKSSVKIKKHTPLQAIISFENTFLDVRWLDFYCTKP